MKPEILLSSVRIDDRYLRSRQQLISDVVLTYQWEVLNDRVPDAEPSHCIENFRIAAGLSEGPRQGVVFLDSDLYKWIEAVAYSLTIQRNAALEANADEGIEMINLAQGTDGYINTYYMICEPDQRFQNLTEGHELYCAGHLFEAAVAYYEATGKQKILEIATRFADHLVRYFLPGDGVNRGYPGHPEVELALIKLYQLTKKEDYLRLCVYFLDIRGAGERRRDIEAQKGGFKRHWGDLLLGAPSTYDQTHAAVREQRLATGHAVRAMYLYSAMADAARLTGDEGLKDALMALYDDTVNRQMYITGGIGAAAEREQFTVDYDLPNDSMYAETCASVGLMMFASRMWALTNEASCYDIWEKALYNTVLAGMSEDGRHFFYVNPLTVNPAVIRANPTFRHVRTTRAKWFGVACCPTNVARTVLSVGKSIYRRSEGALYVLSHIDSRFSQDGQTLRISHSGDCYTLSVDGPETEILLRVPRGFAMASENGQIHDGYLRIFHSGGSATYEYTLSPLIRVMYSHPRVSGNVGKGCLTYGQMVYCLEEADNGPNLCELALVRGNEFERVEMDWLPEGMCAFRCQGVRLSEDGFKAGYSQEPPRQEPATLTFIPYSQWNNRGEGEMCTWINEVV